MLAWTSDDERERSPGLKPIKFKYTPPSSPISFVPRRRQMTERESSESQSRKRNREARDSRPRPSQGDVVLLGYLDPNRPDIATTAGQQTLLPSDSPSEREGDGEDEDDSRTDGDEGKKAEAKTQQHPEPRSSQKRERPNLPATRLADPIALSTTDADADAEMPDAPGAESHSPNGRRGALRTRFQDRSGHSAESSRYPDLSTSERLRPLKRTNSGGQEGEGEIKRSASTKKKSPIALPSVSDSIASSPKLRQHMLTAPQGSPQTLESISSPRSQDQSLPPVKDLMKVADEELRNLQRPRTSSIGSTASSVYAPNASATPGSASSAQFFIPKTSQPPSSILSFSRVQTDPTPLTMPNPTNIRPLGHSSTNPAEFAMHSVSNKDVHLPFVSASSTASTSTAGATPASTTNDSHPTPSDRSTTVPPPLSPELNSNSTATTPTTAGPTLYKCTHPGCRAPPFQTPYLLNSHRNVHSSDRPYFCPRKDCSRSLPGQGFKRKNEMLRHGLVHNSPGYVCPFCSPEKEHRYPRPDNLQRHVRMHHEEVDVDDERLREVLGQKKGKEEEEGRKKAEAVKKGRGRKGTG